MENLTYSSTTGEAFTITSDSIIRAIKKLKEIEENKVPVERITFEQSLRMFYGYKVYEEKIHPFLIKNTAV